MYRSLGLGIRPEKRTLPVLVTEIPSVENGGVSADGTSSQCIYADDLKWSDNVPLTAEDFIFTWQMAVSPQNTVATTYPYDQIHR